MFEGAYEPDTVVVDVVEESPKRARTSSEELTVQVMFEGVWHRRFLSTSETACGEPYHSQYAPLRRESLVGPLCRNCFTIYELGESDRLKEETERDTK